MKNANEDILITFNDESEWEWSDWEEAFIKAVLEHAGIKAVEIYADDKDEDYISLRVKEIDAANETLFENKYLLYYVDAVEALHIDLLFFYILYQPKGDYSTTRDYGAFLIIRENDGCHCCTLDDD